MDKNTLIFVLLFGIFGVVVIALCSWLRIRSLRAKKAKPIYLPGTYLKRRWEEWTARSAYARAADGEAHDHGPGRSGRAGDVDRQASVRSVMTLPAYMSEPGATEKVLGRAGERDGVDVVVEFPETADESETRREQEMDRIYNARRARAEYRDFREENSRLTREARDRGDFRAAQRLRTERRNREAPSGTGTGSGSGVTLPSATGAPENSTSSLPTSTLSVEDVSRADRGRRVSSISYADVGLARLDGTRLRSDSESEHPLIDGAASIGGRRSRSPSVPRPPYGRTRTRSTSSVLSISTTTDGGNRSRNGSVDDASINLVNMAHSRSPSRSRASSSAPDQPNPTVALPNPPDYENIALHDDDDDDEAPPYTSPVEARQGAPELPQLAALPAIEITANTPVNSTPNTPVSPVRRQSQDLR